MLQSVFRQGVDGEVRLNLHPAVPRDASLLATFYAGGTAALWRVPLVLMKNTQPVAMLRPSSHDTGPNRAELVLWAADAGELTARARMAAPTTEVVRRDLSAASLVLEVTVGMEVIKDHPLPWGRAVTSALAMLKEAGLSQVRITTSDKDLVLGTLVHEEHTVLPQLMAAMAACAADRTVRAEVRSHALTEVAAREQRTQAAEYAARQHDTLTWLLNAASGNRVCAAPLILRELEQWRDAGYMPYLGQTGIVSREHVFQLVGADIVAEAIPPTVLVFGVGNAGFIVADAETILHVWHVFYDRLLPTQRAWFARRRRVFEADRNKVWHGTHGKGTLQCFVSQEIARIVQQMRQSPYSDVALADLVQQRLLSRIPLPDTRAAT